MTVLHALTTALPGGTETSVLRLLPRLAARGVDGLVTILHGDGPMVRRFEEAGVRVYPLGVERGWTTARRRFDEVLAAERPDIVHAYGFKMSVLARLAPRSAGTRPSVVHGIRGLHLTDDENPYGVRARLARLVERVLAGRVDRYIANSPSAIEFLTARGLPRSKFALTPNGIDTAAWPWTPGPRDPVVACVAHLRPRKRIGLVVEALARVRDRRAAFRGVIAGDGPVRPALERQIAGLQLDGAIDLAGRLGPDAVAALLARSRLLVLPSSWEGTPVAVMEAMASGVPVVAFDVPGVRDLVEHGGTGLLVPDGDAAALGDAMAQLLEDPALAAAMGAAGRRRMERDFTIDVHVDAHLAAYAELVACGAARARTVAGGVPS
jgi:glycosyltransferase involved in cell wall biosynthesis